MNKQEIIDLIAKSHDSFTGYINELTAEEYVFSHPQKWSAGQQLAHILLCVKPIVQVLRMDQSAIAQTFGLSERPTLSFEALHTDYQEKLAAGGKAPTRFLPEAASPDQRLHLSESLRNAVGELCVLIDRFDEEDLDRLCLPHPLLGNLTLREMLYNVIHHVQHHHAMAENNLQNREA
jgi:hypothetical protein